MVVVGCAFAFETGFEFIMVWRKTHVVIISMLKRSWTSVLYLMEPRSPLLVDVYWILIWPSPLLHASNTPWWKWRGVTYKSSFCDVQIQVLTWAFPTNTSAEEDSVRFPCAVVLWIGLRILCVFSFKMSLPEWYTSRVRASEVGGSIPRADLFFT